MPVEWCRIVDLDLARKLGAPSCLSTLGKFAAGLISSELSKCRDLTLFRVDLTSAQVLDYRFVYSALASFTEAKARASPRQHRLVFRVREGVQLRILTLGLGWDGREDSRPTWEDALVRIADARRFSVVQIAGTNEVRYLGASETDGQFLSILDAEGGKTAVQLKETVKATLKNDMPIEDIMPNLERLVGNGFVVDRAERNADHRYLSICYLLKILEKEEHNGD